MHGRHIADTRAAVTQAKFNSECGGFILFEVFALAVCIGLYYSSWKLFGGLAFSLVLLVAIFKKIEIFFAVIFTLCWTVFGFYLFAGLFMSLIVGILGAVFVFFLVGGVHSAAYQWGNDIRGGNGGAHAEINSAASVQNYILVNNLYTQQAPINARLEECLGSEFQESQGK